MSKSACNYGGYCRRPSSRQNSDGRCWQHVGKTEPSQSSKNPTPYRVTTLPPSAEHNQEDEPSPWPAPELYEDFDDALRIARTTELGLSQRSLPGIDEDDVAEVVRYDISYHGVDWEPGRHVGTEADLSAILRLKDGRWASLVGGNDYTGWDCQAGADVKIGYTEDEVVRYGLDQESRMRLGYENQPSQLTMCLEESCTNQVDPKQYPSGYCGIHQNDIGQITRTIQQQISGTDYLSDESVRSCAQQLGMDFVQNSDGEILAILKRNDGSYTYFGKEMEPHIDVPRKLNRSQAEQELSAEELAYTFNERSRNDSGYVSPESLLEDARQESEYGDQSTYAQYVRLSNALNPSLNREREQQSRDHQESISGLVENIAEDVYRTTKYKPSRKYRAGAGKVGSPEKDASGKNFIVTGREHVYCRHPSYRGARLSMIITRYEDDGWVVEDTRKSKGWPVYEFSGNASQDEIANELRRIFR